MGASGWLFGAGASTALHAAFWLGAPAAPPPMVDVRQPMVVEMPVDIEPSPVAREPLPPPEPSPAAAPTPTPRAVAAPSLPAAARAGRALVAAPPPLAVPDVADFTLAHGTGESYAGGTTTSRGTSERAVRGPAGAGDGAPAAPSAKGPPAPVAAPTVDASRPASPAGGDWSCSRLFPTHPDAPDRAAVTLVVEVDASGRASRVHVTSDPGHGFGDAARRCAVGQLFTPARGADGVAISGKTRPFIVRFSR